MMRDRPDRPDRPARLEARGVVVDTVTRRVTVDGHLIDLTPIEVSLLYVLVRAHGDVLSRERILRDVWADGPENPEVVDIHIERLRSRLHDDARHPRFIQTVRGRGYRFMTR